jgi:ribonuclease PH
MVALTCVALLADNPPTTSPLPLALLVLSHGMLRRACAVNAVTLALIDAGLPMRDFVTACEAGFIDGHVLLDLNDLESSARGP